MAATLSEILAAIQEVVNEFQRVAGSRWSVSASGDDRITFHHNEYNLRYSIRIQHFGSVNGHYRLYREIEFDSVSSRGSFMMRNKESFEYYALVGSLLGYEHLEELNNKIKAIPIYLGEEE